MNNSALVLTPAVSDIRIAVAVNIEDHKRSLIASARAIPAVSDGLTQELAVDAVKQMKALMASVESSRVEVKAPVLTLGRAIDDAAKQFRAELDAEVTRLMASITAFQTAERRKAEEAERQRLEELRRIEQARQEAEAAERRKREDAERAEAARRKAEEDAFAAFGDNTASQAEVDAIRRGVEALERVNAAREAAEAERRRQAELAAQEAAVRAAVTKAPTVASGMRAREEWTFEVTNLYDLALKRNDLVRMEPNTAAINKAIASGMRECPGLRIYQKVGVRV